MLLSDPFYGDTAAGKPDIMAWITTFPYEKVAGDIEACVKYLQEKGCKDIGCMGFCWGVWACCKASSEGGSGEGFNVDVNFELFSMTFGSVGS